MKNDKFTLNPEGKKTLTPTDLLKMREKLVKSYGGKISGELKYSWTIEEKVANTTYHTLTKRLHEVAPDTKALDQVYQLYERNGVNNLFELILKHAIKGFWILFAIAALLALLKFVFQ